MQCMKLDKSFFNNQMVRGLLALGGLHGRVQGVGLVPGVNTRPLI